MFHTVFNYHLGVNNQVLEEQSMKYVFPFSKDISLITMLNLTITSKRPKPNIMPFIKTFAPLTNSKLTLFVDRMDIVS